MSLAAANEQTPTADESSHEMELTDNSEDELPRLVDDDTSSGEDEEEPETASHRVRHPARGANGLVKHPMKLIAMLRERDLMRQPEEPATAGLTTAAVFAASNERAQACNTTQWLKATSEQDWWVVCLYPQGSE